jgi:tetratricopeptide (TPR) repeat protein
MSDIVDRLLPFLLENRTLSDKGVQQLQKAHKLISNIPKDEREAEDWFVLGYYAQQIQDYDDAQAHYSQAILKKPEFEAAYKFRAAVCIETRQFEDAEYDLNKALALDPDYSDARFEQARLYHEQDQNIKAVDLLEQLILKEPDYSDAYALAGSALEKEGQFENAVAYFNKAIELDPDSGHYYTQRGLASYFSGDFNAAKSDLEIAQKLSGTNYITQFNLGLVLGELDEQIKDAFRYFERAFKKAPDMLSQFAGQAGEFEKKRLLSRIQGLVEKHSKESATSSQFYREQLVTLLTRKLEEATKTPKE